MQLPIQKPHAQIDGPRDLSINSSAKQLQNKNERNLTVKICIFFFLTAPSPCRMDDELLNDYLVTYIERDIFFKVNEDDIIKFFMAMRKRKVKNLK